MVVRPAQFTFHADRAEKKLMKSSQSKAAESTSAASNEEHLVALWLRKQPSNNTRSAYARDARRLFQFLKKRLRCITALDLIFFGDHLMLTGLAPISRARTLTAVRSLLRFAHRAGVLGEDLAEAVTLPKYDNSLADRIIGEEHVLRMIDLECNPRNKAILALLYTCGLRASELCGLRRRDLKQRGPTGQAAIAGKGGRSRVVLLPESVWTRLMQLCADIDPDWAVFRSRSGAALDRSRVLQVVRAAARRAGLTEPVSPHWLRHAHASHALDHGAPLHLVQATLGHASVATTSRYLHARPNQSSSSYLPL